MHGHLCRCMPVKDRYSPSPRRLYTYLACHSFLRGHVNRVNKSKKKQVKPVHEKRGIYESSVLGQEDGRCGSR